MNPTQPGVPLCDIQTSYRQLQPQFEEALQKVTSFRPSIIIIDSYGSPTIQNDLQTFDAGYGLPDPPSFKVLAPYGTVPFNPNDSTMVSWAFETSLDVEWAHSMAPGANIVLMTSPVARNHGTTPSHLHAVARPNITPAMSSKCSASPWPR